MRPARPGTPIFNPRMIPIKSGLHKLKLIRDKGIPLPIRVGYAQIARPTAPIQLGSLFAQRDSFTRDPNLAP